MKLIHMLYFSESLFLSPFKAERMILEAALWQMAKQQAQGKTVF